MNQKILYALWGGIYILCAGLGFIPEPAGAARWCLTGLSLLFFLPPILLLRRGDRDTVKLVGLLSGASLGLTAALLVLSVLTALRYPVVSTILSYVLIIVSSPMTASGYWALSLFLWACLLMGSLSKLRK